MGQTLIVTLACLAFEAFCSGTEMAVVSTDRIKLRQRAASGHSGARLLEWFLDEPQRLLATTLLGTSMAVVVSTVTVTTALEARWPHDNELMTVALLSPVLLIFGETLPKTLARRYSAILAPKLVYPLRVISIVFWPMVVVLGFFTRAVTRVLAIPEERSLVTREELEALLRSPATAAEMTEGERGMVQRIFRFGDTTVYDVMVPLSGVLGLPEDATLDEACREVQEKNHTRMPIYRDRVDQVVGILHTGDLLKAGPAAGTVAQLARPATFVPENAPAVDVLRQLQRDRQGLAVVVDEYGGATGIVTVEDILEEIVGEIEDEYDRAERPLVRQEAPGVFRVAGRARVADANAALHTHLPEGEDYETVAGMLLDRLKRIPRVGEQVTIGGALLTVVSASDRAVEEVRVQIVKK